MKTPLRALAFASLFATLAGCSPSTAAPTDAGADPCTLLAECCATLSGAGATTCQALVTAAREAESAATCTATLQSYTQSGLCGANPLDGSLPSAFDGGPGSCVLTGSCPSGFDAGPGTNDDAAPIVTGTPQCTFLGACPNGGAEYATCTETTDAGVCVAEIVFNLGGGAPIPCASCLDCAAASASAAATCATPPPVDAGPDCGTPPALHPETDAGVYCPFTATGAIHCAAGGQCCEAPTAASGESTCQTLGATCPITGSLNWQCDGPLDCASSTAGPVCCAAGTVANDPVCSYDRGSGFNGSHCAQSCVAGEISVCAAATDPCPNSQQCTAFKIAGVVLGTCL